MVAFCSGRRHWSVIPRVSMQSYLSHNHGLAVVAVAVLSSACTGAETRTTGFLALSSLVLIIAVYAAAVSQIPTTEGSTEIKHVPHYTGPLPSRLFGGYLGVPGTKKRLFYILVQSKRSPESDPLIFWYPFPFTKYYICSNMLPRGSDQT